MATQALVARPIHRLAIPASSTRVAKPAVLFVADALALSAAMLVATEMFRMATGSLPASVRVWLSVTGAILAVYVLRGCYANRCFGAVEELRLVTLTTSWVFLGLTAAMFLAKDDRMSRGVYLLCWLVSVITVPLGRAAARKLFGKRRWWGVPAIVLGSSEASANAIKHVRSNGAFGLTPVGCLVDSPYAAAECAGVPVAGVFDDCRAIRALTSCRHAVIAAEGMGRDQLTRAIELSSEVFPHVLIIPENSGLNSAWVAARDLGGVLGLELRHNLLIAGNRILKRGIDVVVGLCAAVIAAPVVLVAAVWIRIVDPGPAFFSHTRQGANGSSIRVHKLRTMITNADMALLQFLSASDDARAEWERYFKLKRDPRIIPGIGHILRRTSLDELPQLWNVLKGEMSLVGPRPIVEDEVSRYGGAFHIVHRVKPGLTGLWQVSGRNETSYEQRINLDTYYVRNWSIWLDLTILVRTIQVILFRTGAY